jgi:hypothetical protein
MAPPVKRRGTPASIFRAEIERAVADGRRRDDMRLRLTLGDATALRRDRELPLADLSFAGGEMRFLGVRVQSGGVEKSVLELAPED